MIKYKNISSYPLTFYGVTFNPNEIKEVPGFINHIKMIKVTDSIEPKPQAKVIISPAVEKKEVTPKVEAKVQEKPKRQYNRKDKTSNNTTGGVSNGKDNN